MGLTGGLFCAKADAENDKSKLREVKLDTKRMRGT
jgi:hypothetical protein